MTINRLIIALLGDHFTSTNPTSSSGSNETNLKFRIWNISNSTIQNKFKEFTFLPALVPLLTVDALPICWWLPPPWGCSTGFIATPRTLGQQLRLALYLWYARPAFNIGLSIRPPPETRPSKYNIFNRLPK